MNTSLGFRLIRFLYISAITIVFFFMVGYVLTEPVLPEAQHVEVEPITEEYVTATLDGDPSDIHTKFEEQELYGIGSVTSVKGDVVTGEFNNVSFTYTPAEGIQFGKGVLLQLRTSVPDLTGFVQELHANEIDGIVWVMDYDGYAIYADTPKYNLVYKGGKLEIEDNPEHDHRIIQPTIGIITWDKVEDAVYSNLSDTDYTTRKLMHAAVDDIGLTGTYIFTGYRNGELTGTLNNAEFVYSRLSGVRWRDPVVIQVLGGATDDDILRMCMFADSLEQTGTLYITGCDVDHVYGVINGKEVTYEN